MVANLFAAIPADLPEELIEVLHESRAARIERIVSRGHASPAGFWYDQERDEFIVLLSGSAEIHFRDPPERVAMVPGDHLLIPANRRHRVAATAPDRDSVWLAVHCE